MSFWKMMNWVAWALSAWLLLVMLWDFFKVERDARASRDESPDDDDPPSSDDHAHHDEPGSGAGADPHDDATR